MTEMDAPMEDEKKNIWGIVAVSFLITIGVISVPTTILPLYYNIPISLNYFLTFTIYALIIYLSILCIRAFALKYSPDRAFNYKISKFSCWIFRLSPLWITVFLFILMSMVFFSRTNTLIRDDFIRMLKTLLPMGSLLFVGALMFGNVFACIRLKQTVVSDSVIQTSIIAFVSFFLLIISIPIIGYVFRLVLGQLKVDRFAKFLIPIFFFFVVFYFLVNSFKKNYRANKKNIFFSCMAFFSKLSIHTVIFAILIAVIISFFSYVNSIQSSYSPVRQNCNELAAYASQWVELQLQHQDKESTATICDYYDSLLGPVHESANPMEKNNWTSHIAVKGNQVESSVRDIIPLYKIPKNPFTEQSVFECNRIINQLEHVCLIGYLFPMVISEEKKPGPGLIYLGKAEEETGGWSYYAFAFKGKDNSIDDGEFHGGMGLDTLAQLRNGVFLGRFR